MIHAENLSKAYGKHVAVDNLSLTMDSGETFGLLGPNGAGKTTTINMLIGLLRPDSGRVTIGKDLDPSHAPTRQQIGVAPQSLSLYDELSAQENLTFYGKLYDLSGARLAERVGWCLEFSGLTDRRRDRVRTFSGGMKRRLNLACALLHEPPVILMDEPTVGVDPQSRNHLFESIEQLKARGHTMIYTTHYMEEAQRLCDRIAIMDHGKILDCGTLEQLVQRHGGRSVVTAELVRPPEDASQLPTQPDGLSLRFETEQPLEEIGQLTSQGIQFSTLSVAQPDLESVFLSLTGRSLRD